MTRSHPSCRLIVLHYNRCDLLKRFLPSVVTASKNSRYSCQVTVLDNGSQDDSLAYVRSTFPQIKIEIAKENKVLCSFNNCVAKCSEDIVILLNNDMELAPGFVDPLAAPFQESNDVFFVATHEDRAIAYFRNGILSPVIDYRGHETLNCFPGLSLSAGVAAFDRDKYLELGGYDDLFLPGRYEDVDLCYRGWKRGWEGRYQPASKKFHLGGASFDSTFTDHATQAMVFRNAILFMIKNITDPFLMLRFLLSLPVRLITAGLTGKWFLWRGFLQSFSRIRQALKQREKVKKQSRISDRSIIQKINAAQIQIMRASTLPKAAVNFLGKHSLIRRVFFGMGFFTLRLFFPLEYLVLRELIDCESVLDLGCGRHSMVPIIPTWIHTVGVEVFESYYRDAVASRRHKLYIRENILTVDFPAKSFDSVVLLDVLEHLPKEKGNELLLKAEKWARKKVVIFTPNGYLPQDDFDENPYMDHCSGWEVKDFSDRGYKVFGVRGFKAVKRSVDASGHARGTWMDLAQIITYHQPASAFQLFCVKTLS